jgi:predicted nucleic acid-binding protein
MIFTDLQNGDAVFLDANVLIYHFTNHPRYGAPCTALLDRVERLEIEAFTSVDCLSDLAHRLMTIEAMNRLNWPATSLAARLKKNHAEIPKLGLYQQAVVHVGKLGVHVLSVAGSHVLTATRLSQQFELLTGDALIITLMRHQGLTKLASEDDDFDRVAGITRYGPI